MSKGKRRERQAAELYEQAGFETYRPQESKWGETDMFGLFDIVAIPSNNTDSPKHPDKTPVRFVQVKSNRASGVEQWCRDVADRFTGHAFGDFLVCHDREGWRLLSPYDNGGEVTPRVYVDERTKDCKMGEGIIDYLSPDD